MWHGARVRRHLVTASVIMMLWRPAPASAQSETPPPWQLPEPEPLAWVHLEGPHGLALEQDLDSTRHNDWRLICIAPCDKQAPTSRPFRVSGAGVFPSKDFDLDPDDRGRATVRVSGGSIPVYILGVVGLSGGVGAAGIGVAFELGAFGGMGDSSSTKDGLYLMAFGAPVAILGAVMMAKSRWPDVDGDVRSTESGERHRPRTRRSSLVEPPDGAGAYDTSITALEWPPEAATAASAALPHAWMVRILDGTF
jgi:hypothetical protein